MTTSKDLAALSFSFTAGIAAGTFFFTYLANHGAAPRIWYSSSCIALISTVTLLALLATDRRKDAIWAVMLYLSLGILCTSTSSIAGIGANQEPADGLALSSITYIREVIDNAGFASQETAPLLKALLTGDKSGLENDTISAFRDSGASHILALSGLHLGIIYLILMKLLSALGNAPTMKIVSSIIIISFSGFYTIATGASPSLVRAFLFIVLNESAKLLHRKSSPVRVFCAALMIQLAVSPDVIRSTGFQLSYLAMAGIFFLFPILKAWYPVEPGKFKLDFNVTRKIWNAAALAISCQIFTGPLACFKFGTFPRYFLITNLLTLPVTSILMAVGAGTVILEAIGICPGFMISVTDRLASGLLFIVNVISGI